MPIAEPRPASTVVLLRPAARFEVLLVRRSDSIAFMGGAHVFPGGRVDEADRAGVREDFVEGTDAAIARMNDIDAGDAVAHYLAAVRELFEEAGVLLARRHGTIVTLDDDTTGRFAVHRDNLLAGKTSLREVVREEGLRLALEDLTYFAHWVTPEIEIKRFDTRFFVARAPAGQTPIHDQGETIHSEWLDPREAVERSLREEIALPPPTWTTLSTLAKFDTIEEVVRWAGQKPVPRVQPGYLKRGDETLLLYPGDPLYPPLEGFDTPEQTRFALKNRRWQPVQPD